MIRQHEMNLIQVLQRVFAMVVLLNFLFVIVMPDASFSKSAGLEGRHEGLYSSPNNLSQAVVIGFLLWFPLWSGQGLWVGGSISMLSLTVQLLSDSATGLLSLCLLTILGTLIWIKHRWSGGGLWIKACMVLIATIILLQSEEILNSVGRDKSMTGRTFIWSYVLSEMKIDGREEIGYGYGGFWDPFGQSKFVIQDNIKQTHNGYLDWYLQLGYAGTILGIVFLVLVAKRLLWRMRTNTHVRIILITSAILLNNFTEASFLSPRNPYWSILIILFIHEGPNFISTTRRTVAVEKKDISYIAPALA